MEGQSASNELIMREDGVSLTVANNAAAKNQLTSLLVTNKHVAPDNAS